MDSYTGRQYKTWAGKISATEVSSMYGELMFADPASVMLRDPEGFDFMMRMYRGIKASNHPWYKALPKASRDWLDDGIDAAL